jgi:hypothetical protein
MCLPSGCRHASPLSGCGSSLMVTGTLYSLHCGRPITGVEVNCDMVVGPPVVEARLGGGIVDATDPLCGGPGGDASCSILVELLAVAAPLGGNWEYALHPASIPISAPPRIHLVRPMGIFSRGQQIIPDRFPLRDQTEVVYAKKSCSYMCYWPCHFWCS